MQYCYLCAVNDIYFRIDARIDPHTWTRVRACLHARTHAWTYGHTINTYNISVLY